MVSMNHDPMNKLDPRNAEFGKVKNVNDACQSLRSVMSLCSPVNLYFGGGGTSASHWTTESRSIYTSKTAAHRKFQQEFADDAEDSKSEFMSAREESMANRRRASGRSHTSRSSVNTSRSNPGVRRSVKSRPPTPFSPDGPKKMAWGAAPETNPVPIPTPAKETGRSSRHSNDAGRRSRSRRNKNKIPRHLRTTVPTLIGGMCVDPDPVMSANSDQFNYTKQMTESCLERANDKTHNMHLDVFMEYCEAKAKFGKVMLKNS